MSERPHQTGRSRLHVIAEVLVASTPATAALCLGGASTWALGSLALLSSAAFGLIATAAWRSHRALHLPSFALIFAAAVAAVLLQLLPLPLSLLKVISPAAGELRDFVLVPLGLPGDGPITLDPPATWRELAKHLGYLALFVAAAHSARSRTGRRNIIAGVAWAGTAIALMALIHKLLAVDSLFGLYRFEHATPPIVTPFGNPNHLAAFVALSASCALALALGEKDRARSSLWAMGFVVSGAVVVLSLSRGGVLFFAMAQLLAALFVWQRRMRARESLSSKAAPRGFAPFVWRVARFQRTGVIVAGALVAIAIGAFVGLEEVGRELDANDSLEKIDQGAKYRLWPLMWRAARQFLFTGMGRGAWEAAFTRFQDASPDVVYTHPENVVLQLTAEFGAVFALGLTVAAALLVWRAVRRASLSEADVVIAAALLSAVLHDLFDFSLELPATASAVVVLLGVLLRYRDDDPADEVRRLSLSGTSAAAVAVAAGVLATFALWAGRSTLSDAEGRLAKAIQARPSPATLLEAARPLVRDHPADYRLHSLAASAAAGPLAGPGGDPTLALAFANRALFLWPLDAGAHQSAARALLRAGRRMQAMSEYRLAYEAGDHRSLEEATRLARTEAELRAITPASPRAIASVVTMLWGANRRDQALALEDWAREELDAGPSTSELWALSAAHRSAAGRVDEALALAKEAVRLDPQSPRAALVLAETLERAGRTSEAIPVLEAAIRRDITQVDCTLTLARLLHQSGERDEARGILHRLTGQVSTAAQRARIQSLSAEFLLSEGRTAKALDAFLVAVRQDPTNPGHRYAAARAYEHAQRPDEALKQIREGLRLEGKLRAELQPWLDRLEAQQKEIDARRKAESVLGTAGADVSAP